MSPQLSRAGEWFLHSGIQEPNGGVARYYRWDLGRNHTVSTEITGYAISVFVYLHSITQDGRYLDRAIAAAHFLTRTAWDPAGHTMPFEIDPPAFTYFFDCGIIVRGLLSAWRVTREQEFLDVAVALGQSMAADFVSEAGDFHPILSLPDKRPVKRDALRWSRSSGCYQLKAAMAWWDLFEATGDTQFREPYQHVLEDSLRTCGEFLPGVSDRPKIVDRLHAYCYFLEGILSRAAEPCCAATICDGICRVAHHLREIAPEFERSDVYAQVLRLRLCTDWAGVMPLDITAARFEAERLAGFQRPCGGYSFGRKGVAAEAWLPYINPVSTAFAAQALELWGSHQGGGARGRLDLLI